MADFHLPGSLMLAFKYHCSKCYRPWTEEAPADEFAALTLVCADCRRREKRNWIIEGIGVGAAVVGAIAEIIYLLNGGSP